MVITMRWLQHLFARARPNLGMQKTFSFLGLMGCVALASALLSLQLRSASASSSQRTHDPDALLADLFFSKQDQLGRFHLVIGRMINTRPSKSHYVYSELLALLLSRHSMRPQANCGMVLGVTHDIEGFWIRGRADRDRKLSKIDCASDLKETLITYQPNSETITAARNEIIRQWEGRPRKVNEVNERQILEILKNTNQHFNRAVRRLSSRPREEREKEVQERQEIMILARVFLSKIIREDWPAREHLSISARDFQELDEMEFLAWLAENRTDAEVLLDGPPNVTENMKGESILSKTFHREKIFRIDREQNSAPQRTFLLTYLPDDQKPQIDMSRMCKEHNLQPDRESDLICAAKNYPLTIYPKITFLITYIPARLNSPDGLAIRALGRLSQFPEFIHFRKRGAEYGLDELFLVTTDRRLQ